MTAILEVEDLHVAYGETRVLHGIGFTVETRGIITILGANGAGRRRPFGPSADAPRGRGSDGGVSMAGQRGHRPPGIAHVPEGRGTFVGFTVEENLRLGAYVRRDRTAVSQDMERVYGYFPVLGQRRRQAAGTLSGGEQQMLALGRALMLRPRLLLLDEPSLGLAPRVVQEFFRIVRSINQREGVSVLLVEQNAALALGLADRAYLLETGRVVLAGPASEIRKDDAVRRAYLGY
jgi:branched-chain amino acid transport system ATP-binding protein